MDRLKFSRLLQRSILAALKEFQDENPDESIYAVGIQADTEEFEVVCYLTTEEVLQEVAEQYYDEGYRYAGGIEREMTVKWLALWLRWYGLATLPSDVNLPYGVKIDRGFMTLLDAGEFGPDHDGVEPYLVEVLAKLAASKPWRELADRDIVVGLLDFEDPRVFLRTATRINDYTLVRRLWAEYEAGEAVDQDLDSPGED